MSSALATLRAIQVLSARAFRRYDCRLMPRDGRHNWIRYGLPMLLAVAALVLLGIESIQAWAGGHTDEGLKQIIFLFAAIAALLATQLIHYRDLLRFSILSYFLALLPLAYTVVGRFRSVPFCRPVNGACAWIDLGPISVEPSELAKVALIMLLAWVLRHEEMVRQHSLKMAAIAIGLSAIVMGLILEQPALGMVLTILCPVVVLIAISGIRRRHLAALVVLAALGAPVVWYSGTCAKLGAQCPVCAHVPALRHLPQFIKHYQRARVYALFSNDPRILEEGGYQQERALEALGSGGVFGKGTGSIPVARHVPEAHTDMILALIGEQYGLLGVGAILLAYSLLFGSGFAIAFAHQEPAGRLLAIGLVVLMAGQTIFNLGVVLRLLPVTGLTLPFVSYGGSSLVANFAIVGLLINIARHERRRIF